jgi:peptidoglycan/xylan/chitin deacetylase (PgdA/CDA1 family)
MVLPERGSSGGRRSVAGKRRPDKRPSTGIQFDQLYEEGAHRRRMMVISLHDRISGHAGRVRALGRFLTYATSKGMSGSPRKDEIARYVLANRAGTPVIERGAPDKTGLPGPTA